MNKTTGESSKTKKVVLYEESNQSTSQLLTKVDLESLVRKTNPAELNTAPTAFWDANDTLKTGEIDDSNLKQQLTIVESGVLYSAKLYNDLKTKNEQLAKQLKKKLGDLDEQRRNFESLNAMKQAETDESRRIQQLYQEVDTIEDEILKQTHYSRQLDHIMTRLKTNQLKFDSHMGLMEATMPSIIKEEEDVAHLKRCLSVGLGKATLVLEETKASLAVARKDRESLMRKRLDEVKNAEMLQDWMARRKEAKMNLAIELRGDLTKEEERFLLDQINAKVEETKNLQKANEESSKLLHDTEAFFAKLKSITGVVSLENMAEKFSLQKISKIDLEKEVAEVERKLSHAKKELLYQEKLYADLKSSGAGQADLSRTTTDKLKADIELARGDVKITKAQSERLATVLLELQQSSNGLLQRLIPHLDIIDDYSSSSSIPSSANGNNNGSNNMELMALNKSISGSVDTSSRNIANVTQRTLATTLDALNQSEQVLAKMLDTVTNGTESNTSTSSISLIVGSASAPLLFNNSSTGGSNNSMAVTSFPFHDGSGHGNNLMMTSGIEESDFNDTGGVNIRVKSRKMKRADELSMIYKQAGSVGGNVNNNNTSTNNNMNNNNGNGGGNSNGNTSMGSNNATSTSGVAGGSHTSHALKSQGGAGAKKLLGLLSNGNNFEGGDIPSRELVKIKSERRLQEEIQRLRREKKKNKLLQQQGTRKHSLAAVKVKAMAAATAGVSTKNGDDGRAQTAGGNGGATAATPTAGASAGGVGFEDDDDGKMAADMEFKMMAMNLAAKEQQEYCKKLSSSGNMLLSDATNVRSDVMTKVKAFFDQKPELE